jgi:hypothetical protein
VHPLLERKKEEKKRKKRKERNERTQMGEISFVDTWTEEIERK